MVDCLGVPVISEAVEGSYSIINKSVAKQSSVGELNYKVLIRLVPREGFEPSRDYSQRILSPIPAYLPHATTRYQVVFTDVSAVKARYVRLGIDS